MAEERRLRLAKRQLMLAQIARREARFALAQAIAEEERSASIQTRASELLGEYAKRTSEYTSKHLGKHLGEHLGEHTSGHLSDAGKGQIGQSLSSDLAFIRSLQAMSDSAGEAHRDASEQAAFQVRTLAAAETKMSAHETRVAQETRALAELKARREVPPKLTTPSKLARKLHASPAKPAPATPDQNAAKATLVPKPEAEPPQPPRT